MKAAIKQSNMLKLAEYQHYLYTHPQLRYLFFELTDKCNLNCVHCGSKCTGLNNNFLDYDVIRKTLDAVAEKYDPRNILVCITGGEPLLYPDIYKMIAYARGLGFPVGITSNGTMIGDEEAGRLKASGLNTISISIDGIGEVHNRFRCSDTAFDKAIEGIRALKRVGIWAQPITVVHKDNINQLDEIYTYLLSEKCYSWRLTNIDPIGRAISSNHLLLDGNELKRMFDFVHEKRFDPNNPMEVTLGCAHFLTEYYENELRSAYFQCGAGTQIAGITAKGDIIACLDIERRDDLVQGNIYKDDFIDVWENHFKVFRRDRSELSRSCAECENKTICMGDSAHTWDYENNEPNYCVAKLLKEE